jgi:hypothetical protein
MFFLAFTLLGCGDVKEGYVRGQVRFRGQPVGNGLIVFAPNEEKGTVGKLAMSELGPDGSYQLSVEGRPVVSPGWYRVSVVSMQMPLPGKYRDPVRSNIQCEIVPHRENICDLNLD